MFEFLDSLLHSGASRVIVWMLISVLVLAGAAARVEHWFRGKKREDPERLYELSRMTRKSEYQIFKEASGTWNLPEHTIKEDFKRYLLYEEVPFYVRDFLRGRTTGP